MAEIEIPLFLIYTVIGSTVWNIILVSLGAALGASWETVLVYLDRYSSVIRVLLIAGTAFWLIRFIRKKWNRKKEAC